MSTKECFFEGWYIFNNRNGIHNGKINYLAGGVIAGYSRDANSGHSKNLGPRKLLLGLHMMETDELAFLKFEFGSLDVKPVFWWMKKELGYLGEGEGYNGVYSFADRGPLAKFLERELRRINKVPPLEVIQLIDIDGMRNVFFNDSNKRYIVRDGIKKGQLGYLDFYRRLGN
jgi:hypothetical protein